MADQTAKEFDSTGSSGHYVSGRTVIRESDGEVVSIHESHWAACEALMAMPALVEDAKRNRILAEKVARELHMGDPPPRLDPDV